MATNTALSADAPQHYSFTNNWFEMSAKNVWNTLIPQTNPTRILEVGSFEGKSACWLIETLSREKSIEIHCIDTWEGGEEHAGSDMSAIEERFHRNISFASANALHKPSVVLHKGYSDVMLSKLLAEGKAGYFDFVYIDGSHQAPDVLVDAALGFRLLKVNGLMAFDDYIGSEDNPADNDILLCPKMAIDAFINTHFRKLTYYNAPLYQLYIRKTSD